MYIDCLLTWPIQWSLASSCCCCACLPYPSLPTYPPTHLPTYPPTYLPTYLHSYVCTLLCTHMHTRTLHTHILYIHTKFVVSTALYAEDVRRSAKQCSISTVPDRVNRRFRATRRPGVAAADSQPVCWVVQIGGRKFGIDGLHMGLAHGTWMVGG
ncbi:hypothetical protein BZA05DRAFT_269129 [Tricharina praecox]|uniref:uncharacterized protein n=1 Tax=Tricharina praecox TaxID=43433 RepID=UPI0022203A1A|nr:uncharacterized protein BZA05DRAFT_269129 [Tricharina praecox]KAI5853758.1 hypothetical protein BZA05DRAFT_269129 [Tricharina praecox]